jgi:mono/diheme cytochrome c family protein
MKPSYLLAALPFAIAFVGSVDPLLEKHDTLFKEAQSATIKLRVVDLSGASAEETLTMSRDNQWRYDTGEFLVICDGKQVTKFYKRSKTYTQNPFDAKSVASLSQVTHLWPYTRLLSDDFLKQISSARRGAQRTFMGNKVFEIAVSREGAGAATFLVDSTSGLVRGVNYKTATGKEMIVQAYEINLSPTAMASEKFAWTPPAGAELAKDAPVATVGWAQVRGIFDQNCVRCHSGGAPKAGLDFSSYSALMSSGAIVPGDPDSSKLIKVLRRGAMPPRNPLDSALVDVLARWIGEGAKE